MLVGGERRRVAVRCATQPRGVNRVTLQVAVQNRRMDVALPAYRARVPQPARNKFDRLQKRAPARSLIRFLVPTSRQSRRGENRTRPGSKILGGEILSTDAAEIVVDVRRVHAPALSMTVEVLKQLLSRQIPAGLDDAR